MRKKITPFLKIGDLVRALVRETLRDGHLIVSFEGDLLNVSNHTDKVFSPGDSILLQLESITPLSFKMIPEHKERPRPASWRA